MAERNNLLISLDPKDMPGLVEPRDLQVSYVQVEPLQRLMFKSDKIIQL